MKKILIAHLILVSVLFFSCSSDPKIEREQFILKEVQKEVKRQLKCPSTALFPSEKEDKYSVNESSKDTFLVYSWVDSQNSYGAMIRSAYIAKVFEKSGNIKIIDLNFFDK